MGFLLRVFVRYTFTLTALVLTQAPDGVLLPDKATIFLSAIEDSQYKDQRINCKISTEGRQQLQQPNLTVTNRTLQPL